MKILWVDDDGSQIEAIFEELADLGHEIHQVTSRDEALEYLSSCVKLDSEVELILLDQNMPEIEAGIDDSDSGFLLYCALRNGEFGSWGENVPVIFVTGWAGVVNQRFEGAMENGETLPAPLGIVEKPLDRDRGCELVMANIATADYLRNLFTDDLRDDLLKFAHKVALGREESCLTAQRLIEAICVSIGKVSPLVAAVCQFVDWIESQDDHVQKFLRSCADEVFENSVVVDEFFAA